MKLFTILAALAIFAAGSATAGPKAPKLCSETRADCASVLTAPSIATKKFNPGHYMLPYTGESLATVLNRTDEVCAEPALKGMQVRMYWAALETSGGQYTFDGVERLYRRLATCKKRLILQVLAAKFDERSDGIVPADLANRLAKTEKGYIARFWEPEVMDRFIALNTALGERFDREPYFEGMIIAETATGKAGDGYTASAFLAQMTRATKAIAAAWPTSRVIVFNNFIQGSTTQQAVDFMKTLSASGVALGGPDVLPPPHAGTLGERIYRGELGGVDYRGRMLSGFSVQIPELGGSKGEHTPRELYDHCARTNKCRYMFWVRNTTAGGAAQKWSTGILPFIRANPSL
jgi:hypothetical protein